MIETVDHCCVWRRFKCVRAVSCADRYGAAATDEILSSNFVL